MLVIKLVFHSVRTIEPIGVVHVPCYRRRLKRRLERRAQVITLRLGSRLSHASTYALHAKSVACWLLGILGRILVRVLSWKRTTKDNLQLLGPNFQVKAAT